jgi:hypothetical protein
MRQPLSERWFWLLVENGQAGGVEEPDAGPVDVAVALGFHRVGGVEQPERGPGGPGGQPEQTAHAQFSFEWMTIGWPVLWKKMPG